MKKLLLFLVCFILLDNGAQAQSDFFAPIGAEWYYGSTGFINNVHYRRYWSEKDTVIEGQDCRKISGAYVPREGDSAVIHPLFVYSSGDTVLYYNSAFGKFTPIFIFNTKVGDTLSFYIPHYLPHNDTNVTIQVIVENVDTLTIAGLDLRRIWARPYVNGAWGITLVRPYIERIGSLFEFLPFDSELILPESREKAFRCYRDQEISYQATIPCDTLPTKSTNVATSIESEDNGFAIYPNPNNGTFNIIIGSIYPDYGKISILDLSGKDIHQLYVDRHENKMNKYSVSLSLSSGVYILRWTQKGIDYTQKLVVL